MYLFSRGAISSHHFCQQSLVSIKCVQFKASTVSSGMHGSLVVGFGLGVIGFHLGVVVSLRGGHGG